MHPPLLAINATLNSDRAQAPGRRRHNTIGSSRIGQALGCSQQLEVSMAGALTGPSTAVPLNSGSIWDSDQLSVGQLSTTGGLNGWSPFRTLNSQTSQQWELLGSVQPLGSSLPLEVSTTGALKGLSTAGPLNNGSFQHELGQRLEN